MNSSVHILNLVIDPGNYFGSMDRHNVRSARRPLLLGLDLLRFFDCGKESHVYKL